MDNVREKLVELLDYSYQVAKAKCDKYDNNCYGCPKIAERDWGNECLDSFMVDELIANDVTVQEWIPVSERLPEDFVSVLGCISDAEPFPQVRECYATNEGFYFPALRGIYPVSHWCKMPTPPKGEENE